MKLSLYEKLHMRHRFLRYRYVSEVPCIRYVLNAGFRGQTLVDVGANWGVFSYYMSRAAGVDGSVYAFEAQPELGQHLEKVKVSFRLANLQIVNEGLSSEPGILQLRRDKIGSGRASFNNESNIDLETLDIFVTTLDQFFATRKHNSIRFIKCDVEGHELDVFKGAEKTLRGDGPALLFECHHSEAENGELFDYLTSLGYDGVFYHVAPEDHSRFRTKDRGQYIHFSKFDQYPYVRPSVRHRNYIFLRDVAEMQRLRHYTANK